MEPTPNAHGQINVGQPRKKNTAALFGTDSVFNQEPESHMTVKVKRKDKAGRTTIETVEVPYKPAERIVLVPTVEGNGHGVQVTVYKKYSFKTTGIDTAAPQ